VAEVLAANDIVDIIGATLELKPAGSGRLKALCPFHHEKTPSFTVNRNRQIYHCFGCGKGGDALDFLQEHDGMTFAEALRKLADRGGVRLPALTERDGKADFLRTHVLEFGKFAANQYQEWLRHPMRGSLGRQYLKTRQLKDETFQRFGVGYAPDGFDNLLNVARAAGISDSIIEASGLFKKGERGSFYDFFRNRVMFPIKNVAGNIVAFGGRDLGDSSAKYINSPETVVYKKSHVLYGLHEAREALRRKQCAILVEGYFDLLRCFDAGIENVVASCGTALTSEQAALIRRYVPEAVVVYDGDAAGIRAALKGISILATAGLRVRAMALPEGQDPDDYIREHGPEAFQERMAGAPDFVSFYISMNQSRTASIEGRTQVAQEIFAILQGLGDEMRVDEYLKQTAHELGLNEWACRAEYQKSRRKAAQRTMPRIEEMPSDRPLNREDCEFLAVLLEQPLIRQRVAEELRGVTLESGPMAQVLDKILDGKADRLDESLEGEARRLYTAAAGLDEFVSKSPEELVAKRLAGLKKEALRAHATRMREAIQEAERASDPNRVRQLLEQQRQLIQQIEKMGAA